MVSPMAGVRLNCPMVPPMMVVGRTARDTASATSIVRCIPLVAILSKADTRTIRNTAGER